MIRTFASIVQVSALVAIGLSFNSCSSASKSPQTPSDLNTAPTRGTTTLETVVLLEAQHHYEEEVKPEALSVLAEDVRAATERHIRRSRPSRMIIDSRIHPERNPTFNISAQGEIDAAEIRRLHDHLMNAFELRSRSRLLGLEFYLENHER